MAPSFGIFFVHCVAFASAFPHLHHLSEKRGLGSLVGGVVGGVTTTLLGSPTGPDPADYRYQAPGASDHRSPCPGINTLANHGYIPRSGQGISLQQVVAALEDAVNFAPNFALVFATGAFSAAGVPVGGNLDLGALTGTALNHPAAMFHSDDTVNKGGDASVNTTMVQQMLNDGYMLPFKNPPADYLDSASLSATHIRRLKETSGSGLVADLNLPNEPKEDGECALLLLGLGQTGADGNATNALSRRFPKAWANDFLVLNKFPADYVRPTIGWQQTDLVLLTAAVLANSKAINAYGVV